MTIKTTLTRTQFIRLSLWRHFNRLTFYFYAVTASAVTAYAFVYESYIWLLVGWLPFVIYLGVGVFTAWQTSRDEQNPIFLPTEYKFDKSGVMIYSAQGDSQLGWELFQNWKTIAQCYVLQLRSGPILAIPKIDVPITKRNKFENLLDDYLK